jgi:hypothetical protein
VNIEDFENRVYPVDGKHPKVTDYFLRDEREKNIYSFIQNNVYALCAKKKTLTLIVDKFQDEEDKQYFNNIVAKISNTKSPIVILTGKLR